jgi:uncharacterized protein (TIGR02444 family)
MAQMISLWTFACKLYNEPAVKNACLQLQDNNDVNVPLLLMACWLVQTPSVISIVHVGKLQAMASDWNDDCIRPLRILRQNMKTRTSSQEINQKSRNKKSNDKGDAAAWELVREQVKATELLAEQQLLQQMERYIYQQVLPISEMESRSSQSETSRFVSIFDSGEQWADHALAVLAQCLPALIASLPTSPQARFSLVDIILSIMAATVPAESQMSYDDVLERISR